MGLNLGGTTRQQGLDTEPMPLDPSQFQGVRPGFDALDLHGPPPAQELGNVWLRHANALSKGGLREFSLGEQGCDVEAEWGHLMNLCGLHGQCTFDLIHRVFLNSNAVVPIEQSSTRAVRFAMSAGPLTHARLQRRQAEAAQQNLSLLGALTESELLHLQFIRKSMPGDATWKDAVAIIEDTA